jgi:hypothetical protein
MSHITARRGLAVGAALALTLSACADSAPEPASAAAASGSGGTVADSDAGSDTRSVPSSAAGSAASPSAATSAAAGSKDSASAASGGTARDSAAAAPVVAGTPVGAPTTWAQFEAALGASLGVSCPDLQEAEAGTRLDETMIAKGAVYLATCGGGAYGENTIGAVFFAEEADVKEGLASMVRASVGKTSWVIADGQWAVLVNKSKDAEGTLATKVEGIVGGERIDTP